MDQKPSDRLRKPARPLRTAGIAAGGAALLVTASFGGSALAQTFNPPAVEVVEIADEPNVDPIASFSVLAVDGLTITVDGANSVDPDGEVVSYLWDFGDGQTGDGAATGHVYGDYGTYTVTLTVTDDAGDEGVFSVDVTLNAPPPPPPPPADDGPTYGNYPPGYPMPRIPGTDQPDTSACASGTGMTTGAGEQVCA